MQIDPRQPEHHFVVAHDGTKWYIVEMDVSSEGTVWDHEIHNWRWPTDEEQGDTVQGLFENLTDILDRANRGW